MYQGMQNGDSQRELAKLYVELIDALKEKSYELIDVKAHLDWLVSMMMRIVSGDLDIDGMVRQYVEYIEKIIEPLKDHLLTLPKEPLLIASPLHNGKNIMDLDEVMNKSPTNIDSELLNAELLEAKL
jgi:hypothetical protein